jgi:hypothetical protein
MGPETRKRLRETPWIKLAGLVLGATSLMVAISQTGACWPETMQAHAYDVAMLERDIESLADEDQRIRADIKENSERVYGLIEQAIKTMRESDAKNETTLQLINEKLGLMRGRR